MTSATITHTIQAALGPETVQAQPATPGLYVYQIPDNVDIEAPCRWRIGHHSGLLLAAYPTSEAAHLGAAELADWADWTEDAEVIRRRAVGKHRDGEAMNDLWNRVHNSGGHFANCSHFA